MVAVDTAAGTSSDTLVASVSTIMIETETAPCNNINNEINQLDNVSIPNTNSNHNNDLSDATSREEEAIVGSQEPEATDEDKNIVVVAAAAAQEENQFLEQTIDISVQEDPVAHDMTEVNTGDIGEGETVVVSSATADYVKAVEEDAVNNINNESKECSMNDSKDGYNPNVEPPLDEEVETGLFETVTWDNSVDEHEAVLEVVLDAGLVGSGPTCDSITTPTPSIGDESSATLMMLPGGNSGTSTIEAKSTVVATELPIIPTEQVAVEPTTLICPSFPSSPTEPKSNGGSPLKIPFRTPKFGVDQKQKKQPKHQHIQPSSSSSSTSSFSPSFVPVQQQPSLVLTLPIDSLHSIASFLSPVEWTYFGRCNKGTNKICTEIFRRVRMHGFRCATEVVTAWKMRQHADAKELCALYVQAGVPIYPSCLGHSYHTLVWRLRVEAKHMEEQRNTIVQESASSSSSPSSSSNPADEGTNNTSNGRSSFSGPATHVSASSGTSGLAANEATTRRGNNDSGPVSPPPEVDPFYRHREDARTREGFVPDPGYGLGGGLSFLEEKALFAMKAKEEESDGDHLAGSIRRQMSMSHQIHRVSAGRGGVHGAHHHPTNNAPFLNFQMEALNRFGFRLGGSSGVTGRDARNRSPMTRSSSFTDLRFRPPKVVLKVHRHLLDQHLLGRQIVNDHDGSMITPPVSLSADFFHPYFSFRSTPITSHTVKPNTPSASTFTATTDESWPRHLVPDWNHPISFPAAAVGAPFVAIGNPQMHHRNMGEPVGQEDATDTLSHQAVSEGLAIRYDSDSDAEPNAGPVYRPASMEGTRGMAIDDHRSIHQAPNLVPQRPTGTVSSTILSSSSASERLMGQAFAFQNNLLSNVDLDVYSASSSNAKVVDDDAIGQKMRSYLKNRYAVYHRRLEKHLANNDSASFEECVLDFWDEFLPQTAQIQYYDKYTAVPRVSSLHQFLTRPCPKAVGTIQCQIERIKVGSKKKGVNMKGRFFPTYEYRLFIRHHPSDPASESSNESNNNKSNTPRRDTVLMIAKNRGRKHVEVPGQAPVTSVSKKGSNNYYLYLPQQDDVDVHYDSVNSSERSFYGPIPNGLGIYGFKQDPNALLGRLQSNFIGTEFQIFTPRAARLKPKPLNGRSMTVPSNINPGVSSDEDVLYEGGPAGAEFSSNSTRRRNRFGRLSMRGRSSNDPRMMEDGQALDPIDPDSPGVTLRRSRSSGDATPGRKSRTSRRVSAADSLQNHHTPFPQPSMYEEEDGAITYTANLLGSRPRIMDVCVPKVGLDGLGMEWKQYIENSEHVDATSSTNRMLNHLKTLQQRVDGEEGGRLTGAGMNSETRDSEGGYSPPDDFGLLVLQNRPPWWNVELGSFVLNFGGRVSMASIKNFQLCDPNDQDYVMLQFGRIQGRHSFTMDFQHPLTAVQAFAIAISSLQSKISFG